MKDVVIIGGGIIGCCCAWYLRESGFNVTILDKGDFSTGCSYGNSGMIVPSHFMPLASPGIIAKGLRWMTKKSSPFYIRSRLDLQLAHWLWRFYRSANKKHVIEAAPLLRDMHLEGHEFYEYLNSMPGFDFQFEKKGILMAYQTSQAEHEEADMAEMAFELGIETNIISPIALKTLETGCRMDVRGAVHYPGDAHLSPHVLMKQMWDSLKQSGVEFKSDHEVLKFEDSGKEGASLFLNDHSILKAKHIVVATGSWSGILMRRSGFRLPMQDGKGYSMTLLKSQGKPVVPSILTEARVAITPMGDHLRVAGTLEISGMDQKINSFKIKSILDAVQSYYPDLHINDPGPAWYGYRPCSPDGMPYIGMWKKDSSITLATGHAMMGLSLAPATGRMVRDILQGKELINPKLASNRFKK